LINEIPVGHNELDIHGIGTSYSKVDPARFRMYFRFDFGGTEIEIRFHERVVILFIDKSPWILVAHLNEHSAKLRYPSYVQPLECSLWPFPCL
jgi:hypothetical protein